jgi:hypothetical protein
MRKSSGPQQRTLNQAAQVLSLIQAQPGITTADLVADMKLPVTAITHRLSYLSDEGKIQGVRNGRPLSWYPAGRGYLDEPTSPAADMPTYPDVGQSKPAEPGTITLPLTVLKDPEVLRVLRTHIK